MALIDIAHRGGTRRVDPQGVVRVLRVESPEAPAFPYSLLYADDNTVLLLAEAEKDSVIDHVGLVRVSYDASRDDAGNHVAGYAWLNPARVTEIGQTAYEATPQFPAWVRLRGEDGVYNVTEESARDIRQATGP